MRIPIKITNLIIHASQALGHMSLSYPIPFNASHNPHRLTPPDPYLEYPYDCCGPDDRWLYPCRGYHHLLNTPEGAATAAWPAGTIVNWTISGIGNHYGGSCQVGFSTDGGETFRVATSYEGNCPHRNAGNGPDGQSFPFTVPSDLPPGVQIFAWIWYNREQELNMNCAAINILGPPAPSTNTYLSSSTRTQGIRTSTRGTHDKAPRPVAWSDRPQMLVADDGNGCLTPHTTAELRYPEPGPDVVSGDGVYPLELPSGACGPGEMLAKQASEG